MLRKLVGESWTEESWSIEQLAKSLKCFIDLQKGNVLKVGRMKSRKNVPTFNLHQLLQNQLSSNTVTLKKGLNGCTNFVLLFYVHKNCFERIDIILSKTVINNLFKTLEYIIFAMDEVLSSVKLSEFDCLVPFHSALVV